MFSVIDSSLLVVSVLVSICNGCVPCSKAKTFLETLQTSSRDNALNVATISGDFLNEREFPDLTQMHLH